MVDGAAAKTVKEEAAELQGVGSSGVAAGGELFQWLTIGREILGWEACTKAVQEEERSWSAAVLLVAAKLVSWCKIDRERLGGVCCYAMQHPRLYICGEGGS
jgi:hypothetical protein